MAMTLRADKGAILSWNEMDANFKACIGAHNFLHAYDLKANGTDGGTFTSGAWRTRNLNTVKTNTISGASLLANQVTLPGGDYFTICSAPSFAVNNVALRLQRVSPSSDTVIKAKSGLAVATSYGWTALSVYGFFTLTESSILELQHICETTKVDNGLGNVNSVVTTDAILAEVMFWKLA